MGTSTPVQTLIFWAIPQNSACYSLAPGFQKVCHITVHQKSGRRQIKKKQVILGPRPYPGGWVIQDHCPKFLKRSRGRIFSCVRPFYERPVSDLDRSLHRSLWVQVTHSSFIEGSHMTKNMASSHENFTRSFNAIKCYSTLS